MRIIYIHQYFNTTEMAGSTRSFEMARRLAVLGHEVHIVTSWRRPDGRKGWFVEHVDGFVVHWLPVAYDNSMGFWSRMLAFALFAIRAGSRAYKISGDLVFATSTPLTIALPGAYVSWRLKVPMVFEVRDLWPSIPIALGYLRNPLVKSFALWLERFAYSRSKRIIALSSGMADRISQTGFPLDLITVIPNSCDLTLFAPNGDGARRFFASHPELGTGPIVLYPGTLGRVNGVAYLVHLAKLMIEYKKDARFVVIGDGAEAALVEDLARQLGVLGKNYFQYRAKPKKELVDAFSAASVVISLVIDEPALWENSANKVFDALASGTAVAINYKGWQKELLEEAGAGIILGPNPIDAVAPLLKLLDSPQRLADCGARARKLAEERFDRDKLALQLEGVLLETFGKE